MNGKSLRGVARGKAFAAILVIVGTVVAEVLGFLLVVLLRVSDPIVEQTVPEALGAAAAVIGVALLGGAKMAKPALDDVVHAFRFGWWCLAVTVSLLCFDMVIYVTEGTAVNPDWFGQVVKLAVFCLFIGIFEEFVFRGVVFQALLGLMGGTHRGVVRAVLLTSVLFGTAHVTSDDFSCAESVAQALLKIVQTGLYSVLLCTIVLRTRRLGGVSLFHAFDDFVIVTPGIAFFNESIDIDYVVQGDDAVPTIMYYLLVIALYLPFVIKSFREIEREQYAYRGVFMEDAVEEYVREQQRARLDAERVALEPIATTWPGQDAYRVESAHTPDPQVEDVRRPAPRQVATRQPYADTSGKWGAQRREGRPPAPKGL